MGKVVDTRLIEAAAILREQQQSAGTADRMIELEERRQGLIKAVMDDMRPISSLCNPWTYVKPTDVNSVLRAE